MHQRSKHLQSTPRITALCMGITMLLAVVLLSGCADDTPSHDLNLSEPTLQCRNQKSECRKALVAIQADLQRNPENATLYAERSLVYLLVGAYDQALEDAARAFDMDNQNELALRRLAAALNAKEQYDKALRALNRAEAVTETLPEHLALRGLIARNRGDYDAAFTLFQQASELDDESWLYFHEMAISQHLAGNHELAIEYLEEALDLTDENEQLLTELGLAYYNIGDFDSAIDYFDDAMDLQPYNAQLYSLTALMWAKLEDWDEAEEYDTVGRKLSSRSTGQDYESYLDLNAEEDLRIIYGSSTFDLPVSKTLGL